MGICGIIAQHSTLQRTNEQHSLTCQNHRHNSHEVLKATHLVQGIAYLESNQGNYRAAQQLFQQGTDNCPPHAPLFNAWASMEVSPCIAIAQCASYDTQQATQHACVKFSIIVWLIALNVLCTRSRKSDNMHM